MLAVRGGAVLAPRLVAAQPGGAALSLSSGTVLISGGTGELGRQVATHLVRAHAARSLLLLTRKGDQAELAPLRAELGVAGVFAANRADPVPSAAAIVIIISIMI